MRKLRTNSTPVLFHTLHVSSIRIFLSFRITVVYITIQTISPVKLLGVIGISSITNRLFSARTLHEKPYFLFPNVLERWYYKKKSRWNMIFLVSFFLSFLKDDISFSREYHLILSTQNGRRSFSKKCLEIWCFLQVFWKDGLSKKFAPVHDLFCNIWKDGISFFPKILYFVFRRKMKEDGLYEKHVNIWYFLYVCINVTNMILPCCQKAKIILFRKNTPKGDISGIVEKDDIHPRKYGISVKTPYWRPR